MLVAQKQLDTNFVHKSNLKINMKKQRKDYVMVDIDGQKKSWGQFKDEFEREKKEQEERLEKQRQEEEAR